MKKVFKAQKIYTENGSVDNGYLIIENDKFLAITDHYNGSCEVQDLKEKQIIPGIIDIHSHGCMGYSATSTNVDEIYGYTKAIASTGVCNVYATTQELDTMAQVAQIILSKKVIGARILGIHAEGPFRHPKYMGASKGFTWPKPSVEYAERMVEAAKGCLSYMSVSTDLNDIEPVIEYLRSKHIRIAAGHTDADYAAMNSAFTMGVTAITHFGNAMRPIHQREGGCIVAGLLDPNVYLELICDHVHLAPEIIDLYLKVKYHERILLISDSSELASMPKGRYYARGKERIVTKDGRIVLDDGTISGSGQSILHGMKNLIFKHHLPVTEVIKMASLQPARYFQIDDQKGSIQIGKDADFVILDQQWNVIQTYVEGTMQYDHDSDTNLWNPLMKKLSVD